MSSIWWHYCIEIFQILSTFLVLFTLLEMRKERDYAYQPDLLIDNTNIYIERKGNRVYFKEKCIEKNDIDRDHVTTRVYNAGVGIAKNASFTINMDSLDDFIMYIRKEYCPNIQIQRVNSFYTFSFGMINIHSGGEILFIKSQAQEIYKVNEMTIIGWILRQMFMEEMTFDELQKKLPISFPPIHAEIVYYDVQNIQYKKYIELNISFLSFTQDAESNLIGEIGLMVVPKVSRIKKIRNTKFHDIISSICIE